MDAVDEYIPSRSRHRQAVPDADRGRLHDHRSWHRHHRSVSSAASSRSTRRSRSSASARATQKTTVTGVEMFRKLLDEGQAGENVGLLLRGTKREDVERGMVVMQAGHHHPAHQLRGLGLHPVEGGGRPSHAVLQQLPSAVLLPHHGRDRRRDPARGHRDGHARRQHRDDRRADPAHRHGRGPALRDPRGQPHRRRRPGHQEPPAPGQDAPTRPRTPAPATASAKTSVCRSTSASVWCGLKSAMLWNGVSRIPGSGTTGGARPSSSSSTARRRHAVARRRAEPVLGPAAPAAGRATADPASAITPATPSANRSAGSPPRSPRRAGRSTAWRGSRQRQRVGGQGCRRRRRRRSRAEHPARRGGRRPRPSCRTPRRGPRRRSACRPPAGPGPAPRRPVAPPGPRRGVCVSSMTRARRAGG